MSPIEVAAAVLALLAAPGPTNALLAIAGAERGFRAGPQLVAVVLGGYALTVVPLALVGARLLGAIPGGRQALTLAAALWVGWLAISMWRAAGGARRQAEVTPRRLLVTTLLNPKALVFGLILLPAAGAGRQALLLAIFAGLVLLVSTGWIALGAALRATGAGGATGLPPRWQRAAALFLGAVALWLLARLAGLA